MGGHSSVARALVANGRSWVHCPGNNRDFFNHILPLLYLSPVLDEGSFWVLYVTLLEATDTKFSVLDYTTGWMVSATVWHTLAVGGIHFSSLQCTMCVCVCVVCEYGMGPEFACLACLSSIQEAPAKHAAFFQGCRRATRPGQSQWGGGDWRWEWKWNKLTCDSLKSIFVLIFILWGIIHF